MFAPWQRKTTTKARSLTWPSAFPDGVGTRLGTRLAPGRLRVHLVQPVRQMLQIVGDVAGVFGSWQGGQILMTSRSGMAS